MRSYADPYAAPAEPKKSRKTLLFALAGVALLLAAAVLIAVPIIRNRQITKVRQQTSAQVDYIIGSQKDKPIRMERWDPLQEKYVTYYEYTYDEDGCLIKQTLIMSVDEDNPKNRRWQEYKYRYSDNGELDSCTITRYMEYEGEKETERTWKLQYSYDSGHRLKSVKTYFEGEQTLTTKYIYEDGLLDRTEQTAAEGILITTEMSFTYDDDHLYSIENVTYHDGEEYSRNMIVYVYDDDRIDGVRGDEEVKLATRYVYDD